MAQLISIRLSRSDACPWGFRLQGGKDFGTPLVVQKVNNGSPAERAGLQAGDAVIKVNNTEVYNLRHKDAQDAIVRAGQAFEVTVQRGGSTWQPQVTPIGTTPKPAMGSYVTPVTKTSLAAQHQDPLHIGSGHNNKAKPFTSVQLNGGPKNLMNKQYNTPLNIYSEQTIRETLDKHSEVLETGAVGVNFKKNEKIYNAANSEVFKMLQEADNEPEPEAPTSPVHVTAPSTDHSHMSPAPVSGLRHVTAPIDRPVTNNTGGLPAGQNICADCERLIVGVFVRIKDKNLHVECFKCSTCGTNLKNQGYYTIHNKMYCDIHAKLAARQNPPSGTEGCIPFTVPPGAKIPVSAISAALAAHSTHPLNGGTAPPPDHAPSTPGYAPVSAPACDNLHVQVSPTLSNDSNQITHESNLLMKIASSNNHETERHSKLSPSHESNTLVKITPYENTHARVSPTSSQASPKSDSSTSGTLNGYRKVLPPHQGGVYKMPGNFSGPKPYSFGATPSPLSPVSAPLSAPLSPYSAPLSPFANQQQPGKFPVSKPIGVFKEEESINPEKPEEGVPLSQLSDSSLEANLCPIKKETELKEQHDVKDIIQLQEKQLQTNELAQSQEKSQTIAELLQKKEQKTEEVPKVGLTPKQVVPIPQEIFKPEEQTQTKQVEQKPNLDLIPEEEPKPKEDLKLNVEPKLDANVQSKENQLNGHHTSEVVQKVHEHKIESQQSTCSLEVTEITKDASKTVSSVQPAVERPCVPAPIVSSDKRTSEIFKTAISQNEPIICNGNIDKGKVVSVIANSICEDLTQMQKLCKFENTGELQNKSFSSFMKSENVSESKVTKSADIISETKQVQQSYSAKDVVHQEDAFAPKSTPFYVSKTVLGDTVLHNPVNLPQTMYTPEASGQQFSNPPKVDTKPNVIYNPCFPTLENPKVDSVVHNPAYNVPQASNMPTIPMQQFSNPPKKETKQGTISNPCFPKMQFNFHPAQPKKRSNSVSSKIQKSSSMSTSSSSMDLLSALTVAPEKPFSLCASPVSFSYTNTSSDLPTLDTLPTFATSFQPITTQTETYKSTQAPIQPPYSPSIQSKPIVESPLSPKPTIPYKRTQSFPPELPEEVSSMERSQFASSGSHKSTSFGTGSYPSNVAPAHKHDVPLHVHIAHQPRSSTPSLINKPAAVIPAYQANIVTTEHREVQSNIFSPTACRSPVPTVGIPVNQFKLQTSTKEAQVFRPPSVAEGNYDTGYETYQEESKVHHDYDKVTGLRRTMNVQESQRHKELNRQQVSNTSEVKATPNMITKIERKHTVKEEFERTQKAKVIEIRTGPNGKVTRQEIASSAAPQSPLSYPPPAMSPLTQQFGQSKHHQSLSQSHQTTSSLSAYGPQSLNQYKAPQPTGFPLVKSPGVSMAKTMSVPSVCDPTPPGAGGVGGAAGAPKGAAPKAGTFGVASAPKRGRGILNKAVGPGGRVPLCGHCNTYVRGPFISALGRIWCPDHFVCTNASCKRPLADIGFVEEQGQLYCEYCFEQFIAPPCDKCHAKIKGDCLNAIGKHFHPECFNCCYCGKLFGNNPFFLEDGQPYCQADWNEMFTTKCFACGFPVEAGDRWVEALSNNYHSQCFNCTMCKKNLEGQSFYAKGGRPFCKNHAR